MLLDGILGVEYVGHDTHCLWHKTPPCVGTLGNSYATADLIMTKHLLIGKSLRQILHKYPILHKMNFEG